MTRATSIIFLDETHPIDALELIAHEENWEFARDDDNEIIVRIVLIFQHSINLQQEPILADGLYSL